MTNNVGKMNSKQKSCVKKVILNVGRRHLLTFLVKWLTLSAGSKKFLVFPVNQKTYNVGNSSFLIYLVIWKISNVGNLWLPIRLKKVLIRYPKKEDKLKTMSIKKELNWTILDKKLEMPRNISKKRHKR